MPAKNIIKRFVPEAYYHLYNRGVEKRKIFLDEQDYTIFLSYLKTYLLPKDLKTLRALIENPEINWREKNKALKLMHLNNFHSHLHILSFCLMPNHFHLLIKQTEANVIDTFMNSFGTRYSMYFNKKYKRVGKLFQGLYKAVLVETDEQLHYLTRYIHRNPLPLLQGTALENYPYSSYPAYLHKTSIQWIQPDIILSAFRPTGFNSYQSFVEDNTLNTAAIEHIAPVIFDEN